MQDLSIMQSFETLDHLNEYPPYFILFQVVLLFLVASDLLVQVAMVRILHDNATLNMFAFEMTYHSDWELSSIKA